EIVADRSHGRGDLRARAGFVVAVVDREEATQAVGDRQEGRGRAVGRTSTLDPEVLRTVAPVAEPPRELGEQARLAEPRLAGDEGDLALSRVRGAEGVDERLELALATDERRRGGLPRLLDGRRPPPRADD